LKISHANAAGPRIMIVDDNRDAAEMLAEILNTAGFSTIALLDAESAMDQLSKFQPDFILIDIGLPAVDGYELARQIKAVEEFKDVRLIAITGYGQESDRQRSFDTGFCEHLVKPVDIRQLETILRRR